MRTVFDDLGSLGPSYEAVDWASTPLDPVSSWSDTLVSTVGLMMHSRQFPVTLTWGPELVESLCDHLLSEVADPDDDIALLVLRA